MSSMRTFLLIFAAFGSVYFSRADDIFGDWENPNDIFGRSKSICGKEFETLQEDLKYCKDELQTLRETSQCKGPRVIKQPSVAEHYMKRFLNVLLASAKFKHRTLGEGNEISVNMNLYFNSKTLSVLQAFASDDTNGHTWAELDASFLTLFEGDPDFKGIYVGSPTTDESSSDFSTTGLEKYHMTILIGVVSSVAFSVIWIYITGGSFGSAVFVGSVLVVSFCFGWTWWSEIEHQKMQYLVELSKSELEDGAIPDFCKKPNSGWFGWILKSSRREECLKYLKAKNVHPMASVDLATVFSKTLQTLAFSWLPALAKSVSDALDVFFGDSFLGWSTGYFARILTGPVLLVTLLLVFVVYMVTKSSFRFKNFLFEVEVGSKKESAQRIVQQLPPSVEPANVETYDEHSDEELSVYEQAVISSGSSLSSERKKLKDKTGSFKIRPPQRLRRSDTVSLPLRLRGPETAVARSSKHKVVNRHMPLLDPLCLSPGGSSRRQTEDRKFREIRRAFSVIERPVVQVDTMYYN